ncbi:MAG: RusA family crossover junction endodeoxyribonuclease [Ardenticatenaceae bacterium]
MTFAIALVKKPISAQKRGKKQRYQQEIRDAAIKSIGKTKLPLFYEELYVRITWFHAIKPNLDVDNIAKPILDALVGIVYDDDNRIAQCLITRVKSRPKSFLSKRYISLEFRTQLEDLFENHQDVLYIEVGPLYLPEVVFGPIDGGSK